MRDEGFATAAGWDDRPVEPAFEEPEIESGGVLWPALAGGVVALWLLVAIGLAWPRLRALDNLQLVEFAAALAVVPVLVIGLWLLVQRNSRAEARRFGETAQAMRAEAAQLERTVTALSRAIDQNRAKLAEQVSALLAMGDAANARLGGIERDVGAEVARIEEQARTIERAAASAHTSITALIEALPRTRGQVEEATVALDHAGTSAAEHAAMLEFRLQALAEQGRDAEATAKGAAEALAAHTAEIEARSGAAGVTLAAAAGQLSQTVEALVDRTASTVDGARQGIAAQGEAMLATLSAHQEALARAGQEGADALAARIAQTDSVIERVSGRLEAQAASGDLIVERLRTGIAEVEGQLDRLHVQGSERAQVLAASISALGGSADAMTEALKAGDAMATRTINTTESLLIALDAATREIDETLPDALNRLDDRIAGTKRVVGDTKPDLLALVTAAESTHDAIEAVAGVIAEQRRTVDQLSGQLLDTLGQGRAKADALGLTVEEAIDRTRRFAEEAAPQLVQSLSKVRDSAAAAADNARASLVGIIPDAVAKLERAGAQALRRATEGSVEREVQALAAATEVAVEAAARAAERVAREAQAIADQTAIVEARIEQAREEQGQNDRIDMTRRVAGLIEALNSAAIDVTKVIGAADVADSAWAAYLKGDRGVFTRRAVRLLDGETARDVARLYDVDDHFRDATNRYIHDFEAMLRSILQQPDGQPLSMTLLSSDMGKLYVALAQAIERLR